MDALAERDVHLVDAEEAVGPVAVSLETKAAQATAREWRAELIRLIVGHEAERGQDQVLLAGADDRIAEAPFDDGRTCAVVERAEHIGAGPPEAVARVGEGGEPL